MKRKTSPFLLTQMIISLSLINLSDSTSLFFPHAEGQKAPQTFALNFNDVEISEFINVMSRILGKNIILSDKVRGKITISSEASV